MKLKFVILFFPGGHHFVSVNEGDMGRYCNVCENGMQTGMLCDYCGVIVDSTSCLHSLSSSFSCKVAAVTNAGAEIVHHWVVLRLIQWFLYFRISISRNCTICKVEEIVLEPVRRFS